MKIKVSELCSPALDWAVAKANGAKDICIKKQLECFGSGHYITLSSLWKYDNLTAEVFMPSIDWAQGGPILEREKIGVDTWNDKIPGLEWAAANDVTINQYGETDRRTWCGPTPLIAAMRCYVASKLGDEVEVPDELCEV